MTPVEADPWPQALCAGDFPAADNRDGGNGCCQGSRQAIAQLGERVAVDEVDAG